MIIMSKPTAWDKVVNARAAGKIGVDDLINGITDDFMELHGDRAYGDDPAVYGGIGTMDDIPTTFVGIRKGADLNSNIERHFGSAEPDGYRKALRLMKQAEKFNRPIVTLINTPGAYPGVDAEYHGIGYTIAQLILQGMQLTVPYISVIVGEGGSGGALALAVGDCVWAFEDSIYSVLSPEGYATILWKDPSRMKEAASVMKLTPDELLSEGIIDRIIPEVNTVDGFERFRGDLVKKIKELNAMSKDEMLQKRLARYRNF